MDRELLKELGIEDVQALTADDIAAARPKVIEAGKKAVEAKDVTRAKALAALADTLATRKTELDAKAAEDADELAKAAAKFTDPEPEAEKVEEPAKAEDAQPEPVRAEETKAAEPAKVEAPKAAETPKAETATPKAEAQTTTTEPATMPVAASSAMPKPPAANAPVAPKVALATITASSASNELTAGAPIPSLAVLASLTADQMQVLEGNPRMVGKFPVANMFVEYPKDRQLSRDATDSTAKISAVVADGIAETRENLRKLARMRTDDILDLTVTADGGLCAPLNVSYDVFSLGGSLNRPIRDAFPRFAATKGGMRHMTSPTLADVAGEGAGASVRIITEEEDASGSVNKPCLVVDCGDEVEEKVDAITKCLQIGNWSYLTYRERFDEQMRLVDRHFTREAEINLWNRAVANSTALTGGTPTLGLSRDVTNRLVRRASKKRSFHAVPDAVIRVIAPSILFEMFAEDRRNQLPGDSAVATAEAEFRRELAMHNIAVTLSPDIEIAGAQAEGELDPWPTTLEFLMFFEGTHIFLDMGRLDFGLMRDSVLSESNNLRIMEEAFEGLATPGYDSDHITLEVCASGATSGTVEVPCVLS